MYVIHTRYISKVEDSGGTRSPLEGAIYVMGRVDNRFPCSEGCCRRTYTYKDLENTRKWEETNSIVIDKGRSGHNITILKDVEALGKKWEDLKNVSSILKTYFACLRLKHLYPSQFENNRKIHTLWNAGTTYRSKNPDTFFTNHNG